MGAQRLRQMVRGGMRRLLLAPLSVAPTALAAEALTQAWDGSEVHASIGSSTIKFFAPTPLLRLRAEQLLTKEPETIAWLDGLGPDDVLWDVGANVGMFSLYAAAARSCTGSSTTSNVM
jgi:hypothetical protein